MVVLSSSVVLNLFELAAHLYGIKSLAAHLIVKTDQNNEKNAVFTLFGIFNHLEARLRTFRGTPVEKH